MGIRVDPLGARSGSPALAGSKLCSNSMLMITYHEDRLACIEVSNLRRWSGVTHNGTCVLRAACPLHQLHSEPVLFITMLKSLRTSNLWNSIP